MNETNEQAYLGLLRSWERGGADGSIFLALPVVGVAVPRRQDHHLARVLRQRGRTRPQSLTRPWCWPHPVVSCRVTHLVVSGREDVGVVDVSRRFESTVVGSEGRVFAPDFRTALEAEPAAAAFFDSLAQFYRRGYLRWIDATKRRPDVRSARIAEVIDLLKANHKQRPQK